MKNKIIGFLLIVLLVICSIFPVVNSNLINENEIIVNRLKCTIDENEIATVYMKKYDSLNNKIVNEPIKEITRNEAEQIKRELMQIEGKFIGSEIKILEQIKIMEKWDLIPSGVDVKDLFSVLNRFDNITILPTISSFQTPSVIVCGPAISSFLTIGGPQIPIQQLLFSFFKPWWFNSTVQKFDIFNGTSIGGLAAIMPVLVLWGSPMTIINNFGTVIGARTVISPFMAILVAYAGIDIFVSFWTDSYGLNIFDWSIGIYLTGVIVHI